MRLLIITQKVDRNDDILGFFHGWVEEFAKHCEAVTVVALEVGEYEFEKNVRVFSLGKERGVSKIKYLLNFYRFIWQERDNYDAVFVHMNPVYVLLGGFLWRNWGKKIALWYTHKKVDFKLRIAEKLTNIIFTASRESFRLASEKVKVMGHGIDTEIFKPVKKERGGVFEIVTAGRISPVKDYETLVNAVEILAREHISMRIDIIGGPATKSDADYLNRLQTLVKGKKLEQMIHFVGSVPNKNLPAFLAQADLFVNMSHTGSLDKAILEAMACGIPVVTSNEALSDVFGADARTLMFPAGDTEECAHRIRAIHALPQGEYESLSSRLRTTVEKEHNIRALIPRILSVYETGR